MLIESGSSRYAAYVCSWSTFNRSRSALVNTPSTRVDSGEDEDEGRKASGDFVKLEIDPDFLNRPQ